jgi:hypothetical protein
MRAILLDCERDQSSTLRAEPGKIGDYRFACVTWFIFTAQALPSSCWTGLPRRESVETVHQMIAAMRYPGRLLKAYDSALNQQTTTLRPIV